MNKKPVIFRAHIAKITILSYSRAILLIPILRRTENNKTGIPVARPYMSGSFIGECCAKARGNKEPKNIAAEVGQNDNANIIPKKPAPQTPNDSAFLVRNRMIFPFPILNWMILRRMSPTRIKMGPKIRFI